MNFHSTAACVFGILAASLFSSCTASSTTTLQPVVPLEGWTDVELDYEALAPGKSWQVEALQASAGDLGTAKDFIDVGAAFVTFSMEEVEQLFGKMRHGPWAVTIDRTEALRLIKDRAITHQHISLADQQKGHVSISSQVAFIKSFEVEATEFASIADPVVDVVYEGSIVEVTATVATEDRVHLALHFQSHSLKKPIDTVELRLPGLVSAVTIQQPVTTEQSTKLNLDLRAKEAVLIAIPVAGTNDELLIGVVTAATRRITDA